MVRARRLLRRALATLFLAFATAVAGAQVPVTESVAAPEPEPEPEPEWEREREREREEGARLGEFFHRLQVLQQEVQELRGLVEEQAFRIERLTKQQKEQYIDIDQRLVALGNQSPAPTAGGTPRTSVPQPLGDGSAPPEQDAYNNAFNLMKEQRFQESVGAFNQLIIDYPNGQYTPNAFYWLGELYLHPAMDDVEQARQFFTQVLTLYPEHIKVADALYKLGVVHHRLDDRERSLDYLNRVIAEYPDSPAAGLASTYLAEIE